MPTVREGKKTETGVVTPAAQRYKRVRLVVSDIPAGKIADVLVVNGNPLADLGALTDVRIVIHGGEVIRAPDGTR